MTSTTPYELRPMNMDDTIATQIPTANNKPIDANRYATKKTIAQGMLDIALLTANASQLKYILQVLAGIFIVLLGQTNINNPGDKLRVAWLEHLLSSAITGFVVTDVIKMVFGLDTVIQCVTDVCNEIFRNSTRT